MAPRDRLLQPRRAGRAGGEGSKEGLWQLLWSRVSSDSPLLTHGSRSCQRPSKGLLCPWGWAGPALWGWGVPLAVGFWCGAGSKALGAG